MIYTAETLAAELSKRGLEWSDKEAAAALLEETRKTVLSECQADWPEDSNAASEAKALRDPRYKEHLKNMVEARRLASSARINYDKLNWKTFNKEKVNQDAKAWRYKNREWVNEYARKLRYSILEKNIFWAARRRAKKNGLAFNIDVNDIQIPENCPIFGIKLDRNFSDKKRVGPSDDSPSIDRIIPNLGYVKGNIIIISYRANRAKNDLTIQEMQKLVSFYEGLSK